MRKLTLQAVLLLVCLYTKAAAKPVNDTVVHAIDGNISEWNAGSFETDKETQIQYAVDHDSSYLFLAVKISDQGVQRRVMMQGMNMYLDKKGKHRQNTGINFPLQQDMAAMRAGFAGNGDAKTPPDPKAMHEKLSTNMLLLKTFGFEGMEDKTQLIVDEAGISVSYDWDQTNTMYIEYLIPLQFLGKLSELNGKPVSIGWQMNAMSAGGGDAASTPGVTNSAIVGVPRNGASAGRAGGGRTGAVLPSAVPSAPRPNTESSGQIFWTKHVLSF
jgi:hypothetical protein